MKAYRNYRIFKVYENSRVEAVGTKVRWARLPNADLVAGVWRGRVNVFFHLHGTLAKDPAWIPVRMGNGAVFEVHPEDLAEVFRRQPTAKLVHSPEPWAVIATKASGRR